MSVVTYFDGFNTTLFTELNIMFHFNGNHDERDTIGD
jgi:hypothetical protein